MCTLEKNEPVKTETSAFSGEINDTRQTRLSVPFNKESLAATTLSPCFLLPACLFVLYFAKKNIRRMKTLNLAHEILANGLKCCSFFILRMHKKIC